MNIFKKSLLWIVWILLGAPFLFSALGTSVYAQERGQQNARAIEKVKKKVTELGVGEKVRVTVKLRDESEVRGYIASARDDDFTVRLQKTTNDQTFAYSEVKDIKWRSSAWHKWIEIPLVTAIAVIFFVYEMCTQDLC